MIDVRNSKIKFPLNTGRMLLLSSVVMGTAFVTPLSSKVSAAALEEVVVTARKRAEDVTEVPDSIVVLTSSQIERSGVTSVKDIGLLSPNIGSRNDLSPTSTFISVRGINQTRNTEPAVAIVIDGVQASNASQTRQELFDIEQIEVLKGPQGALYGRNAIAGAINITTKKTTEEHSGKLSIGRGNGDALDLKASVSGPIVEDTLFYRLAATYHDDNGIIKNETLNKNVDFKESKTIRGRLTYDAGETFYADLRFSWDDLKAGNYYYTVTRPIGEQFKGKGSNSNDFSNAPRSNPISVSFGEIKDVSLMMENEFDGFIVSSVTAMNETYERYGRVGEGIGNDGPGDLDFGPVPILGNEQVYDVESWSQEIRISSDSNGDLQWMTGVYYVNTDRQDILPVYVDFNGNANLNDEIAAGNVIAPNGTSRTVNAYAVFANVDYDIDDHMTLALGLRYDREDRDQSDNDDVNPLTNSLEESFDEIQPKVSLSYITDEGQMYYATIGKGFRSGGFNSPRSSFPTIFESEVLWNYEIGHKGRYLDDSVSFNVAVFFEDIENRQDFAFDIDQAAQIIYNIPESHAWGIELDGAWQATDNLTLRYGMAWMDSEIEEFANAALFPINTSAAINAASGITGTVDDAFFEGNKLSNFSHWSATFSGDYDMPLNDSDWSMVFHFDYALRGKNYWDVFNTDVEKDVRLLNANLSLENDSWRVKVWGENLADTRYWSNWFNSQTTALPDIGYQAPGRKYGVTVSYEF